MGVPDCARLDANKASNDFVVHGEGAASRVGQDVLCKVAAGQDTAPFNGSLAVVQDAANLCSVLLDFRAHVGSTLPCTVALHVTRIWNRKGLAKSNKVKG